MTHEEELMLFGDDTAVDPFGVQPTTSSGRSVVQDLVRALLEVTAERDELRREVNTLRRGQLAFLTTSARAWAQKHMLGPDETPEVPSPPTVKQVSAFEAAFADAIALLPDPLVPPPPPEAAMTPDDEQDWERF